MAPSLALPLAALPSVSAESYPNPLTPNPTPVATLMFVGFLIYRERQGQVFFKPLKQVEPSPLAMSSSTSALEPVRRVVGRCHRSRPSPLPSARCNKICLHL